MTSIPNLGKVCVGGKTVLDQKLSHNTDGIPNYPAFDDCFQGGIDILAPEDLKVTSGSSANPGAAFYATGASKINYWFGHVLAAPAVGKKFKKGAKMGDVLYTTIGGGSHVHVGLDVRPLTGQTLKYGANGNGPDYTFYPKTVRQQLEGMIEEDTVEAWVGAWLEWYIQGQYREPPQKRPPGAPQDIPDDVWALQKEVSDMLKRSGADKCYQAWRDWYQDPNRKDSNRPSCAPGTIWEEWWEARNRDLSWIT